MAEQVRDGIDGLHFTAGDPASLARTIETAFATPNLWQRLREGIAPVYPMFEHVEALAEMYDELLRPRRATRVG
jgi:glycosyltransferase involved in cell wall biosynthesis